jgi:hypothetical protein
MMSGFFLLAYFASGGMNSAGLVAVVAYFFNHDECTRVMWTPPLRESFSLPFFVWQQLALLYAIKNPCAPLRLVLLTATSLLFLLPWQFAQFVLVLQACALFGAHLLGALEAPSLRRLLTWLHPARGSALVRATVWQCNVDYRHISSGSAIDADAFLCSTG